MQPMLNPKQFSPQQQTQSQQQTQDQPQQEKIEQPDNPFPKQLETEQGTNLFNEAIIMMYDKGYEKLVKALQNVNPEKLPSRLSNIVNITLNKLEQKHKNLTIEIVAEVGSRLLQALIEDMTTDGIIPEMNKKQQLGAIADTINDYALSHKKTVSKQDVQMFLQGLIAKAKEAKQQQKSPQPLLQPKQAGEITHA